MSQVREVAYDVEDYVDDIRYRLSGEPSGSLRRAWYLLATMYARRCIAAEIRNLNSRVLQVRERWFRYKFWIQEKDSREPAAAGTIDASHRPPVPPPQVIRPMEPVGLEDAMRELQGWSTNVEQMRRQSIADLNVVRLLAITGSGGVGKTTVAMSLYRKFADDEFDCRATVVASCHFHLKTVLRSIVKQLHEQRQPNDLEEQGSIEGLQEWGLAILESKLSHQLLGKRFLILVDDIRSVSAWEAIRDSLPLSQKGATTLLITTRLTSVSEACRRCYPGFVLVYEHRQIPKQASYNLFLETISSAVDDDLRPLARPINNGWIIFNTCGGLPLAIVLLAGLVASKLRSEPDSTLDYHLALAAEDLSEGMGDNTIRMVSILNYCYNHLPADLKICLLYLSLFPNGCLVNRKSLIRRWIAEGFIIENHGKAIHEVAEDCFADLISRNLIQPVTYNKTSGRVKGCQIQSLVSEYISAKSRADNFTTVVGNQWETQLPSYKVRRLSVQGYDYDQMDKATLGSSLLSHVRSLTAFGTSMALHSTLLNYQILQILDLENCVGLSYNRLKKVCSLHHLKFLSLRRTDIELIPIKIGMLKYLEVLDIRETNVAELPASVRSLQRMAHLLAGDKSRRIGLMVTEGITKLTALQTLSVVSSELPLRGLEHLRVLAMIWSFHQSTDAACQEAFVSSLDKWRKLESLSIHCEGGFSMEFLGSISKQPEKLEKFKVTNGRFVSFPQWINGLKHLAFLQISVCKLDPLDLNILKDLPKLQSLALGLDFIPTEEIVIQSEGFSELLRFSFDCPVPWLTFRRGAMRKLTYLHLKICSGPARDGSVPFGIRYLQRLTEVVLGYNQKWCANSSSVKMTVEAVKQEIVMHHNPIDLFINGTKHNIEEYAMEWATDNHSETEDGVKDGVLARREQGRRVYQRFKFKKSKMTHKPVPKPRICDLSGGFNCQKELRAAH